MSLDKWATSNSIQLSTNVWIKLLLLLENALKFWGPLTENLNPLQGPTHTLTPSSINIQNRSKNCVWIYNGMHWPPCYRSKLSNTLKSKDLAILVSKKIADTPTKTGWSRAQFQKGQPTPAKLCMLFLTYLRVGEFWPQLYPLWQALDWGLARKWVGPRMPKSQLSRVPWPGNLWMPLAFQPDLRVLQQPHKHSHSLQLANYTQLAHHYIQ